MKFCVLLIIWLAFTYSVSLAQECEPNIIEDTWEQGQKSKIKFEVPARTFKWRIEIEYDEVPNRIDAFQGRGERCNKAQKKCWFNNERHNRQNQAGDVLDVGYLIQFNPTVAPEIVAIKFKYCDARPCAKWNNPDDTIKELILCPAEVPTESPTESSTGGDTDAPTDGPTESPTDTPTEGPTDSSTDKPNEEPSEAPNDTGTEGSTDVSTDAPTDVPTEGTTETPDAGKCIGLLKEYHAWESGSSGKFQITVPEDTDTWQFEITFDKQMDGLDAYQGSEEACDGATCTFTNEIWNGNQDAGNILELTFKSYGNFPAVVTFAFNGVPCEEPPTTTETTEASTEKTTEESTTEPTEAPTIAPTEETTTKEGDCPEAEITDSWNSGMKGKLVIIVPEDVEEWEVSLTFDSSINSMDAYQGQDESCEKMTCTFSSQQWIAIQKAGNILTLEYQVQFDERDYDEYPSLTSFSFNNVPICEKPTEAPTDGPTEIPTESSTDATTEG